MATDPETPATERQTVPIPEQLTRVYTNFVQVLPGGMDVSLALGHQVSGGPPNYSVEVTMSWEEAKFLISALQDSVNAHEAIFGPVRDVMKLAREAAAKIVAEQEAATRASEGDSEDA